MRCKRENAVRTVGSRMTSVASASEAMTASWTRNMSLTSAASEISTSILIEASVGSLILAICGERGGG